MQTDVQIVNNGLSKISASRITYLNPPRTQLEGFMSDHYKLWKETELSKRRWVFALVEAYQLTASEVLTTGVSRKYKYPLPIDCLRPLRGRKTEWAQRGRFIYSADSSLKLDYIKNASEAEFDPLFNDVLACRISWESAEYVTQSSSKKADAKALYDDAVKVAGQMNAFIIGPEEVTSEEESYGWETARYV